MQNSTNSLEGRGPEKTNWIGLGLVALILIAIVVGIPALTFCFFNNYIGIHWGWAALIAAVTFACIAAFLIWLFNSPDDDDSDDYFQ